MSSATIRIFLVHGDPKKKLSEVTLPLDAINKASARGVIFSQMVDDLSGYTETQI